MAIPENVGFVMGRVDRFASRAYNPAIASGRGAKRRRAVRQTTEIAKKLEIWV